MIDSFLLFPNFIRFEKNKTNEGHHFLHLTAPTPETKFILTFNECEIQIYTKLVAVSKVPVHCNKLE